MFSRRQKTLKTISGLLTGLIVLVAVFVFVCPMGAMAMADTTPTSAGAGIAALCDHAGSGPLGASTNTAGGCFGFHLSIMDQFTKALFEKVNVFFVVLFAAFGIVGIIFRAALSDVLRSRLARFRQRFYCYFAVRRELEKKKLAWLSIINGFSIAPVV